jgi:hypothetical protein
VKRLRVGEWVAGLSAVALFVFLFLDWFGPREVPSGTDTIVVGLPGEQFGASGWNSLGWAALAFCVLAIVAGLALLVVNAVNDSPVLPVIFAIFTTLFGFLAVAALLIQVIAQPGPDELVDVQVGWWLGLIACIGITAGGWLSMKQESTPNARERPIDVRPAPPVA